jgi:NTP pyrophosphatase (non-canonical NTP hydrolase)
MTLKGEGRLWDAVEEIVRERRRQDMLKAQGRFKYTCADPELNNGERLAILVEEVGEVARALQTGEGLREEVGQCAAICLAWLQGMSK